MNYKLNVELTDKDYLDYNMFAMKTAPHLKKQIILTRVLICVIYAVGFIFLSIYIPTCAISELGVSIASVSVVVILLALVLFVITVAFVLSQVFLMSEQRAILKWSMRSRRKQGKAIYTPNSTLEFLDETFIETDADTKTEVKYSSVETVRIVENKVIYIHLNSVLAFIMPISSFESKEQYDGFVEFIKTKCAVVETYKK